MLIIIFYCFAIDLSVFNEFFSKLNNYLQKQKLKISSDRILDYTFYILNLFLNLCLALQNLSKMGLNIVHYCPKYLTVDPGRTLTEWVHRCDVVHAPWSSIRDTFLKKKFKNLKISMDTTSASPTLCAVCAAHIQATLKN